MPERLWRILCLILVAAGGTWLGGWSSLCAQAGQGEPRPLYEILPAKVPDLHDRSIEDWKRILPAPTLTEGDFQRTPGKPPPDLPFDIYLGWTATPPRIYAAFELRDNVFLLDWEGDLPAHNEDHVWLGVDADRSGGKFQGYMEQDCGGIEETIEHEAWYCIPDIYYTNRQAQIWQVFLPEGLDAIQALLNRPWVAELPWSDAGGAVAEDGASAILEFMVTPFDLCDFRGPEQSVVSTLAPGQIIGLEIVLVDYDVDVEDTRTPDYGSYYIRWINFNYSDDFEPFLLIPATERPTAIGEESWGRVKRNPH